jgi:hypothetical protein
MFQGLVLAKGQIGAFSGFGSNGFTGSRVWAEAVVAAPSSRKAKAPTTQRLEGFMTHLLWRNA